MVKVKMVDKRNLQGNTIIARKKDTRMQIVNKQRNMLEKAETL